MKPAYKCGIVLLFYLSFFPFGPANGAPAPSLSVTMTADAYSVASGTPVVLTWVTQNAVSAEINPDIGPVDLNGSLTVYPAKTTIYVITARAGKKSVTASVTVAVITGPNISFSLKLGIIQPGQSDTLTWYTGYADACVIEPEIGSVQPSGSITVSPSETTTYTLTAAGSSGTTTASVTVVVIENTPSATPARVARDTLNAYFKNRGQLIRTASGRIYYFAGGYGSAGDVVKAYCSPDGTNWAFAAQAQWDQNAGIGVGLDSRNIIHVVTYTDDRVPYYSRLNTADSPEADHSWEPVHLFENEASFQNADAAIAIDANDVPHVVYQRMETLKGNTYGTVVYGNFVGGIWHTKTIIPKEQRLGYRNKWELGIAIGPDNLPYISVYSADSNLTSYVSTVLKGNSNNPSAFLGKDFGRDKVHSFVIHPNGDVRVSVQYGKNHAHFVHDHHATWEAGWTTLDSGAPYGGGVLVLIDDVPYTVFDMFGGIGLQKELNLPEFVAQVPAGYGGSSYNYGPTPMARWSFYNHHFPGILDLAMRSFVNSADDPIKAGNYSWYVVRTTATKASLSASSRKGLVPFNVDFNDTSITSPGTQIVGWEWDLNNDGVTDSTEENPSHTYTETGLYTVRLKVTDSEGNTDTVTNTDYIVADEDADGDTFPEFEDNCPGIYNQTQADLDNDGIGDVCDDDTDVFSTATFAAQLQKPTSTASTTTDMTALLKDGLLIDAVRIQTGRKSDVLSIRCDTEAKTASSIRLNVFVSGLEAGVSQGVRVYAYGMDAAAVLTTDWVDFQLIAGWNEVDLTGLSALMENFGFLKFRLSASSGWIDISEAEITVASAVGVDDWDLSVSPAALDFGVVGIGEYAWLAVTVSNAGTGVLTIDHISAPGAPFQIIKDECSGNEFCAAGSPCSGYNETGRIIVGIAPTVQGAVTGTLTIYSNDRDRQILELPISATVSPAAEISASVMEGATGLPIPDATLSINRIWSSNEAGPHDQLFSYYKAYSDPLPTDDSDGILWPEEEYSRARSNDEDHVLFEYALSHQFKVRNPFSDMTSFTAKWNGTGGDARDTVLAQSFQAGRSGPLTRVSLKIKKQSISDSFRGNLRVFLKTAYGGEKETILAQSDWLSLNDLPANEYIWVDAVFSQPHPLVKARQYFLEVYSPAFVYSNDVSGIYWALAPQNAYGAGNGYARKNLLWAEATSDFEFRTYIEDQLDQYPQGECDACQGIGSTGIWDDVTSRLRIYNRTNGTWELIASGDHECGYEDVTLAKSVSLSDSAYPDENGWLSFRASTGTYYSYPSPRIATDFFEVAFRQSFTAVTGGGGSATVRDLPAGSYQLTARAPGYYPQTVNLSLTSGDMEPVSLTLTAALPVEITITAPADGAQIDGSTCTVEGVLSEKAQVTVNDVTAQILGTDERNFRATVRLVNGENLITVTAVSLYGKISSADVTVTAYNSGGLIAGKITDKWTGEPISNALVDIYDALGRRSGHTNENGEYTISGVAPGNIMMATYADGFWWDEYSGSIASGQSLAINRSLFPYCAVEISANPSEIDWSESTTLSWLSSNIIDCWIDNGVGRVSNNGSLAVAPERTATYKITANCLGPAHLFPPLGKYTITSSVTVSVKDTPAIIFRVDPEAIRQGESAALTWSLADGLAGEIDQGIGPVAANGTFTVTPDATTTYTLTATGPGGPATASVTVTVTPLLPVAGFQAMPEEIPYGESATLIWSVSGADTVEIDNGIGIIASSGSLQVTPESTTTYTLTAAGPGGTSSVQATVMVTHSAPVVRFEASPKRIVTNQQAVLSWAATDAATVMISGLGELAASGSVNVSPDRMKTYTLTATGPGGTTTASAVVFVYKGHQYDYGDPTPAEQAHLEAVNRARANPEAEAARLGIELNEGLAPGTLDGSPVQPLVYNAQLASAAYFHAADMMEKQYFDHNSPDGRMPRNRIEETGYLPKFWGENIGLRVNMSPVDQTGTVLGIHEDLFLDQGVEGRGHRLSILNPAFKEAGLGTVSGAYAAYPHSWMLTCDFGASTWERNSFLLGVVYDDVNRDGVYTAGEGIGAVNISIHGTGDETLTASAGGYGMPLPPGAYRVIATLPDGNGVVKDVSISGANVKLDILLSEFTTPPAAVFSADRKIIPAGGSAGLTWSVIHADSVSIDNGVGVVATTGALSVSPESTTTYRLTATGQGGMAEETITVYVINPEALPVTEIYATPTSVSAGAATTLSWHVTDADIVNIDNEIGAVDPDGTCAITPASTATYTLTASGPAGSDAASVTVTVTHPRPTAALSADPVMINAGESALLTWETTGADTVTIDPGIGPVEPTGSLSVSPSLSTLYTLSAAGPGGTTTKQVQVTVVHPAPGVNFSTTAGIVLAGESALLSWHVTDADAVSIDNGIGAVQPTGTTLATPGATTTYTLTATGPGGTTTGTVTITVAELSAPPVVAFSASPEVMQSGEAAALSWRVVNAATITIDNGVGDVGASGSVSIAPLQTTTYTLSATGPGGVTTESITVRISAIGITITAPSAGERISRPDVMVKGIFDTPAGIETGIVVNGVLAAVHGNEFVANHVPLQEGINTITVTATGINGDVNHTSVTTTAVRPPKHISLHALSETGTAPLETTIQVEGAFAFSADEPDHNGPGAVILSDGPTENTFGVQINTEGIYYFTASVTDSENNTYTDTIGITVFDSAALDTFLKAKWESMRQAVMESRIADTVRYFSPHRQSAYEEVFQKVGVKLSTMLPNSTGMVLIEAGNSRAKYVADFIVAEGGQPVTYSTMIIYEKDHEGIWRLKFF